MPQSLGCALCTVICLLFAARADAKVTVEPAEKWSNIFGGKDIEVPFVVRGAEGSAEVSWSLVIGPRRLNGAAVADPKKPGHFLVKLPTAVRDIKPRVILKMVLTVTVHSEKKDSIASSEKVLWMFPSDPFADRKKWLESLKITLFDPGETTAALLKNNNIAFKDTVNVAELAGKTEGLVLVGADASFSDYPDLWDALKKLAGRGVPVLCLAPSAGELSLPNAEGLSFHKPAIIRRIDRRLDPAGWLPDGKVAVSGVSLRSEDRQVQAVVEKKDGDWPWLEIDFPAPGGKLVVCGFDFLGKGKWDASPTPRYLFVRLLEYLTEKSEPEASKERND
jgi:hypothetical protein